MIFPNKKMKVNRAFSEEHRDHQDALQPCFQEFLVVLHINYENTAPEAVLHRVLVSMRFPLEVAIQTLSGTYCINPYI